MSHPTVKNFKFEKSKMAAAAILKNRKFVISGLRFDGFWRNLARRCSLALLSRPTVKNLKIHDSGVRHLEKSKYRHISATVDLSLQNMACWRNLTLLTIPFRKSGPSSCTFWLVYALDVSWSFSKTFAVQNDKIAYLNLAIKQQIYM